MSTQRPLTILTGASRGMGLAMARQLLQQGHELLSIARKRNEALACEQWEMDLADPQPAAQKLVAWLQQRAGTAASVTLINNAGLIPPIATLGASDRAAMAQALRVDLEAPLLLASAFLEATAAWTVPRKILNISSGLGRRAMAAQSVYCAAKAGMDHFSRCVALEEAGKANGAHIVSLAPGVIDTDMQVQLRTADPAKFPDVGAFKGMKESGALMSPEDAAAKVLGYLARADFGANPVADVRDA
jgi:NAD(P)-dependent dehydrogenase (short-subunit alcohol dehydrogenase family)